MDETQVIESLATAIGDGVPREKYVDVLKHGLSLHTEQAIRSHVSAFEAEKAKLTAKRDELLSELTAWKGTLEGIDVPDGTPKHQFARNLIAKGSGRNVEEAAKSLAENMVKNINDKHEAALKEKESEIEKMRAESENLKGKYHRTTIERHIDGAVAAMANTDHSITINDATREWLVNDLMKMSKLTESDGLEFFTSFRDPNSGQDMKVPIIVPGGKPTDMSSILLTMSRVDEKAPAWATRKHGFFISMGNGSGARPGIGGLRNIDLGSVSTVKDYKRARAAQK